MSPRTAPSAADCEPAAALSPSLQAWLRGIFHAPLPTSWQVKEVIYTKVRRAGQNEDIPELRLYLERDING